LACLYVIIRFMPTPAFQFNFSSFGKKKDSNLFDVGIYVSMVFFSLKDVLVVMFSVIYERIKC